MRFFEFSEGGVGGGNPFGVRDHNSGKDRQHGKLQLLFLDCAPALNTKLGPLESVSPVFLGNSVADKTPDPFSVVPWCRQSCNRPDLSPA